MIVLTLAHYNTDTELLDAKPVKVYALNTSVETTDKFMATANKLMKAQIELSTAQKNMNYKLVSDTKQIASLGFVTYSQMEIFLDSKITEIIDRERKKIWWEKRKLGLFKFITNIAPTFIKKLFKQ